jgi:hypothetical protein
MDSSSFGLGTVYRICTPICLPITLNLSRQCMYVSLNQVWGATGSVQTCRVSAKDVTQRTKCWLHSHIAVLNSDDESENKRGEGGQRSSETPD